MSVAMMTKGGRAWSGIWKSCHRGRERISLTYGQGLFVFSEWTEKVEVLSEGGDKRRLNRLVTGSVGYSRPD